MQQINNGSVSPKLALTKIFALDVSLAKGWRRQWWSRKHHHLTLLVDEDDEDDEDDEEDLTDVTLVSNDTY